LQRQLAAAQAVVKASDQAAAARAAAVRPQTEREVQALAVKEVPVATVLLIL
jgi:hypothetical protein